jgi:ankyrin repeat protein
MDFENMEVEDDINSQNQSAEEMIRWITASEAAKTLIYKYWRVSRLRFSRLLLESASRLGKADLVRFLIATGGNSVVTEEAFISAVVYDRPKVIKALLEQPNPEVDLTWAFLWASEFQRASISIRLAKYVKMTDTVRNMQRELASMDSDAQLLKAVENGHTEVVRYLIQRFNANPATKDNHAIHLASRHGHTEVVRLLLQDSRVNPAGYTLQVVLRASENGHIEVVRLLLQDGRADPTADNNKAIRMASRNGHAGVVRLLLQDGRANPTAKNNEAIRQAVFGGYAGVVRLLLQDPRVRKTFGENQARALLGVSHTSLDTSVRSVRDLLQEYINQFQRDPEKGGEALRKRLKDPARGW